MDTTGRAAPHSGEREGRSRSPICTRQQRSAGQLCRVVCGGTHIKRTGEVGTIVLKRKNVGKGKERIEIYLQA